MLRLVDTVFNTSENVQPDLVKARRSPIPLYQRQESKFMENLTFDNDTLLLAENLEDPQR